MVNVAFLYRMADEEGIPVIEYPLPETGSVSIQFPGGNCCIGIDERCMDTESKEKVHLGHELGHCCTGSFYSLYSEHDIRQKHENRANIWEIETLIPENEYRAAVKYGCRDVFSLSERFGVTEEFMRMVVCWYKYGSLCVEDYFG